MNYYLIPLLQGETYTDFTSRILALALFDVAKEIWILQDGYIKLVGSLEGETPLEGEPLTTAMVRFGDIEQPIEGGV